MQRYFVDVCQVQGYKYYHIAVYSYNILCLLLYAVLIFLKRLPFLWSSRVSPRGNMATFVELIQNTYPVQYSNGTPSRHTLLSSPKKIHRRKLAAYFSNSQAYNHSTRSIFPQTFSDTHTHTNNNNGFRCPEILQRGFFFHFIVVVLSSLFFYFRFVCNGESQMSIKIRILLLDCGRLDDLPFRRDGLMCTTCECIVYVACNAIDLKYLWH